MPIVILNVSNTLCTKSLQSQCRVRNVLSSSRSLWARPGRAQGWGAWWRWPEAEQGTKCIPRCCTTRAVPEHVPAAEPSAGQMQIRAAMKGLNKGKSDSKCNFGKKCKATSYGRSQYMTITFPEIYRYIF